MVVVVVSRMMPPPATLPEVVVRWFGWSEPSMRARQSGRSLLGSLLVASLFDLDHGREQLTDVVGQVRIAVDVLLETRPLASPVAPSWKQESKQDVKPEMRPEQHPATDAGADHGASDKKESNEG